MPISLREINAGNYDAVIKLDVATDQKTFVAPNVKSIADAYIYNYLIPLAIYDGDTPIGFALHGRDPETENYWIVRLMIDAKYQSKGFGKAAMLALIERISKLPEAKAIFLSFVPGNKAEKLYQSVGFVRTGKTDDDGEIIMRLGLENNSNRKSPI
jgi:diamine N-acetyltransferase